MRVWLDDARPMPEGFDRHATTAQEAIDLLKAGTVTFISLDHDLAEQHYAAWWREVNGAPAAYEGPTGYDVACYIERAVFFGEIPQPGWACHSQNGPGGDRIRAAMRKMEERGHGAEKATG